MMTKAEDTRGRKPAPIFGVENRNRLLQRVSCKNDSDFRLRLERVRWSIFGSTLSTETVVSGLSLLFSFGLFVNSAESINKHSDYIFSYFYYDLQ